MKTKWMAGLLAAGALGLGAYGCSKGSGGGATPAAQASGGLKQIMQDRQLSEADVEAALLTYKPTGKKDDYVIFASGGQSGQVLVIGVPSMRLLKVVAVFTPEPWQGYGYGGLSDAVLKGGQQYPGTTLSWADVHHPNLSESKGDYDGRFLFVNDKANARVAVVDLADFQTKQIVANKLVASDHGGAFVTPDTEYVIETSQYPAPLGREYAPLSEYKTKYRGLAMFWKFDKSKGRIIESESFGIELPPYTQDLADSGKLVSDGYIFINSFNTEMAAGGILEGNPPVESGASQNDTDLLHVINWKKAEALVKAGRAKDIKGVKVLPLDVSASEKVMALIPEPKSPHGVDVTPDGQDIVVGGKLDTHATVYRFEKIKTLMETGTPERTDDYGLPIFPMKDAIRGQVEIGLGPLHTVYDGKGFAYTSVFIESTVAKWDLAQLKVVEKLPVHYNIGHILSAEGDTVSPDGNYVVAMNKMSIDRFANIGPLYPQNFQLIGIDSPKMKLLADMPIGIGEPHYAQMIKADKLKPMKVYPMGTNPYTDEKDEFAVTPGKERIERDGKNVHVYMTAIRSHFTPDRVEVEEGDTVHLHLTSVEQAEDQVHGFTIDMYNVNLSLEPGKHENVTFVADKAGAFPMYCTEFCSALHLEMMGYFMVKPKAK